MKKRSSPRFPVSVDARVIFPDGLSHDCIIRDYCTSGIYLIFNGEAEKIPAGISGRELRVEFVNPLKPDSSPIQIDTRVMRVESHGLGLAFLRENSAAVVALSQLSSRKSEQDRGDLSSASDTYGQATVDELVAMCLRKSDEHLRLILHAFMNIAKNDLSDAANFASSNTQRSSCFGAMNELRTGEKVFIANFRKKLAKQFSVLSISGFRNNFSQDSGQTGGLALLESNELDNWLAVRSLASSLEEYLGETLEALEKRFESISVNPLNTENNPAGPFVLASIFREELDQLMLDEYARRILFGSMDKVMGGGLKKLYDELNESLIARGVLPALAKTMELVRGSGHRGALPRQYAGGELPAAKSGGDVPVSDATHTPVGANVEQSHGPVVVSSQQEQIVTAPQPAPISLPSNNTNEANEANDNQNVASTEPLHKNPILNDSVRQVIHYSRAPVSGGETLIHGEMSGGDIPFHGVQALIRLQQSGLRGEPGDVSPAPVATYSSGQILQAIDQLGEQLGQLDRSEKDVLAHVNQISHVLSGLSDQAGVALSDVDRDAVAYVGGLFNAIHRDPFLPSEARPWYEMLAAPLLKAGILDASLLEDDSHPARQILNRLEKIADRLEGNPSAHAEEVRQQVADILTSIPPKVEDDPDIFVNTLKQLDTLQQQVISSYEENVTRLIDECESEKALKQARNRVFEALEQRLGQRDVPVLVLNLLDAGWKNLLLRTMLKNGEDSIVYKTYLNVIDQLSARLTRAAPFHNDKAMDDNKLLEWIGRMLSIISSDEMKNNAVLNEINDHLNGLGGSLNTTRMASKITGKTMGNDQVAHRPDIIPEDVWQLMLVDLRLLGNREIFRYHPVEGGEQFVSLVWQDKEDGQSVFADSQGLKALDLDVAELGNYLYSNLLERSDNKDISITERATYTVLQSLHNQLAFQANHDSLTGLLNRRAFERELEQACAEVSSTQVAHVLAYMDLDRFNVINAACGHTQGDVLLGKVAELIQKTVEDTAIVARLGGDEFGVLLKNCSRTKGLMQVSRVHDALRKMHFSCGENEFTVTSCIGVSEVSVNSEGAVKLLSAVDSATFTAKENGRDNIQIYNPENVRIASHRNLLDWVGRINVLFDKNLIQLRCQKIAPLHDGVNALPHYEVLLDVHDEAGEQVPVEEFIMAAERYNRIGDIDGWVVSKVFDWLMMHKDKLHRIENLSINLSGASISNHRFMEEIYQQISADDFPASKVCFEVTESIAINNIDSAIRFMKKLKGSGCQFALDDFGKGSSSYSYLRALPVDYVKIDGCFVRDIATNTDDYAVVKSINEIAHVMGKQTVAEYVEDDFAYEAIKLIGIDFVQGYVVEKPIPLDKLFG